MSTEAVIRIVGWGLLTLARLAPDIARAFTGGQSAEEAIAEARAAAVRLKVRTGPGGTWTEDTERRAKRG